jgi:hypothetical protein
MPAWLGRGCNRVRDVHFPMTPTECSERVEAYLLHATYVLRAHYEIVSTRGQGVAAQSLSALKLQLTNLLGEEFSYRDLRSREPAFQRWCWPAASVGTDDHVIPLSLLIGHLASRPDIGGSQLSLRAFLSRFLVLAYIPKEMNAQLIPSNLPVGVDPFDPSLDDCAREDAIWSRYHSPRLGTVIPRPGAPGSRFVALPTSAKPGGHHDCLRTCSAA